MAILFVYFTNSEFLDEFKSYCVDHVIQRPLVERLISHCYVCLSEMDPQDYSPVRWMPSCGCYPFYIHLECARRWALSSGYMCNCACGNNSEEYHDILRKNNVYVPRQDAAWEDSIEASAKLRIIHNACDAASCVCPCGRRLSKRSAASEWFLNRCNAC